MINSMIKRWNGGGSLRRSAGGSLPRSSGGCLERSSGGYLSGISKIVHNERKVNRV
jgi:hypothetical protein